MTLVVLLHPSSCNFFTIIVVKFCNCLLYAVIENRESRWWNEEVAALVNKKRTAFIQVVEGALEAHKKGCSGRH